MWRPIKVYYEQYAIMTDIEHFVSEMGKVNYRFEIRTMGGLRVSKEDRIEWLLGPFEGSTIYLPDTLTRFSEASGQPMDLVKQFVDQEFSTWPFSAHDDMLDCLSRIKDPKVELLWPKEAEATWWGMEKKKSKVAVGTGMIV
jgi:hypothetical protein